MTQTETEQKQYHVDYMARRRIEFRTRMQVMKAELGCNRCPESDWRCLDWHHIDPSTKTVQISHVVGRAAWSWDRILTEVDKCELLCANCHRKEEITESIRLDEERPC